MTHDAYVFGDLSWPMPDPGLIAVWRAMAIDASRWSDWDGFVDDLRVDTIGALVDRVAGESPGSPLHLDISDTGVRLRARLDEHHVDSWQRLAIAWRLAADLGASGEFTWCPCAKLPGDVAYRAVIGDYASQWEKLTGANAALADRHELVERALPAVASIPTLRLDDSGPHEKVTAKPAPPRKGKTPAKKASAKSAKRKRR